VLGLGASTAIRWIERWVTTGSVAALPGTSCTSSRLGTTVGDNPVSTGGSSSDAKSR